jgi:hypothetical protein
MLLCVRLFVPEHVADQTRLRNILLAAQQRMESLGSSASVLPRALQQDDDGDLDMHLSGNQSSGSLPKDAATGSSDSLQMNSVVTNS